MLKTMYFMNRWPRSDCCSDECLLQKDWVQEGLDWKSRHDGGDFLPTVLPLSSVFLKLHLECVNRNPACNKSFVFPLEVVVVPLVRYLLVGFLCLFSPHGLHVCLCFFELLVFGLFMSLFWSWYLVWGHYISLCFFYICVVILCFLMLVRGRMSHVSIVLCLFGVVLNPLSWFVGWMSVFDCFSWVSLCTVSLFLPFYVHGVCFFVSVLKDVSRCLFLISAGHRADFCDERGSVFVVYVVQISTLFI